MSAYYNEVDPYAAAWLRNLIAAGQIAPGDVDERSIVDVRADDLRGYRQCHFFAGIGGWSVALRLAGWSDDEPVWTGSCPCQPLSSAGQRQGHVDERHLWPAFHRLIAECRPATVFGEQVASKDGREWFAAVRADLEADGYACGAAVMPACSVGAPHIRERLWFVADAEGERRRREPGELAEAQSDGIREIPGQGPRGGFSRHRGAARLLADHAKPGWAAQPLGDARADGRPTPEPRRLRDARLVADEPGQREFRRGGLLDGERTAQRHDADRRGADGGLGDAAGAGPQGIEDGRGTLQPQQPPAERASCDASFWSNAEWIACTDGKARPVEPGSFPLAHGVQRRASKLRAYGNAIVPQVAAEFVAAFAEVRL